MPTRNLPFPVMPDQRGPTCGLYALQAAAKALDPANYAMLKATEEKALARPPADAPAGDAHPRPWEVHSLRHFAKRLPVPEGAKTVSEIGEIFDYRAMMALAKEIGLAAATNADTKKQTIRAFVENAIDNDRYVLAPFGVDVSGRNYRSKDEGGEEIEIDYVTTDGEHAHWCLIYGYAKTSGWFGSQSLTWHSVHWGGRHNFNADDFVESSQKLADFSKVYAKPKDFYPIFFEKQGLDWEEWNRTAGKFKADEAKPLTRRPKKIVCFHSKLTENLAGRFVSVGLN